MNADHAQEVYSAANLDRDRRGDVRVRIVGLEREILGLVVVDRLAAILEHQLRQRPRLARQLLAAPGRDGWNKGGTSPPVHTNTPGSSPHSRASMWVSSA